MTRTLDRALRAAASAVAVVVFVRLVAALRRARTRAQEVPLSPVSAGWYVGPEFVERQGLTTGEEPAGEVADIAHFAGETFDPDRLDPTVRRFYERTAEYEMRYRVRWHRPFRTGAALASLGTSRLEQLNLPGPGDESWHRLASWFLCIDEPGAITTDADIDTDTDATDPAREDVRAWIRTDPETDEAVFVALYATHHRDGDGYVNISVPIPGGGVDTVLRPENLALGDDERTGIRLTTAAAGDPGLYLRTPIGPFGVPGGQRFEVWPAEETAGDELLRATHEMWLLGRTFLSVEYAIERA